MKRKRGGKAGHKKGKKKTSVVDEPALEALHVDPEDNISSDQNDDCQVILERNAEPPSLGSDKLRNMANVEANVEADLPNDKLTVKTGPSRVKVKLRSTRVPDPGKSYSDTQTPSETVMSNPKVALEMNEAVMEKEDSTYSDGQTSELQNTVSDKIHRKAASIKIKPSRSSGLSSDNIKDKNINKHSSQQTLSVKNLVLSVSGKTADPSVPQNLYQRETKLSHGDPLCDKKELSAALAVVQKVMKMDAAGPFNAPVDAVALGIPDYFDIIDNPMDFGTICHDLESGSKYMNSEDVYKDVQFIWENCYKYNNKGDYIIDLMKRVKKNFMKYWIAAGLYSEMPSTGAAESTPVGVHDKLHPKSKTKHKRRRYGIDRHKSDCMCAVCVVRRRRKERNESQITTSDVNLSQELKLEGSSPGDNHLSDDGASSLDHSPETDAHADMEEDEIEGKMETPEGTAQPEKHNILENEMEIQYNSVSKNEGSQQSPQESRSEEDSKQSNEDDMDLDFLAQDSDHKDDAEAQEEAALGYRHQDAEKKDRRDSTASKQFKLQGNPLLQENHSVLQLCRGLFTTNKSVWNGPHSLIRSHVVIRDSPIHKAMATLLKQ